ncbi:transcriptional regulator, IclR family [Halogranum rubrum]|uniref:Transcriptional regulator, IclR family n=1 Tax=Halogranum rubrum TaxID=553466 RepID=A0A1I4GWB2_9EURY|nr:IclR family transcriptional regulator [Halogranum rubrum]SFL34255.1 transcriptional regulator, IclR family [Halogranum rubrum]
MTDSTTIPVKATRVSFDVVEALQELDEAGAAEISNHLGIPKSTAHDHLRTLEQLELVVNENGRYRTGTRFLDFGGYARQQMKIYNVARPEIRKLAEQTGEHSNLMVEEHGRGVFLYKAEGTNAVQLDTYNGYRVHLHTTAMGKAILAHFPEKRVRAILDRHGMPTVTEHTVDNEEELFEELAQIRSQGFARDLEERVRGMRCVAAPILRDDEVLGAISVSGPASRMQGERFESEIPDHVLRTANVIEVNMTYS